MKIYIFKPFSVSSFCLKHRQCRIQIMLTDVSVVVFFVHRTYRNNFIVAFHLNHNNSQLKYISSRAFINQLPLCSIFSRLVPFAHQILLFCGRKINKTRILQMQSAYRNAKSKIKWLMCVVHREYFIPSRSLSAIYSQSFLSSLFDCARQCLHFRNNYRVFIFCVWRKLYAWNYVHENLEKKTYVFSLLRLRLWLHSFRMRIFLDCLKLEHYFGWTDSMNSQR